MEPIKTDIRLLFLEALARIDKERANITDYWYSAVKRIDDLEKENQALKQRITELVPK
jgi:hypothetical protein